LIIGVLRNEAVTAEFRRSFRQTVIIKGLPSEALMNILSKRLEYCKEKDVLNKRLLPIANILKDATDNPLSFLTWIDFLCNNSELERENLLDDLKSFTLSHYGVPPEQVEIISKFFLDKGNIFLSEEDILAEANISEDIYQAMVEKGILVPDDVYTPRKYKLSPDFTFFKINEISK
jgi:hypothetical protein